MRPYINGAMVRLTSIVHTLAENEQRFFIPQITEFPQNYACSSVARENE